MSRPSVGPAAITGLPRSRTLRHRVEHVMGMPITLALRGRHADDRSGEDAWQEVLRSLREVDHVFSTYREDSVVSRLRRGELALDDFPVEVAEVLALGEEAYVQSGGAFDVHRTDAQGHQVLDLDGVVKGWAVQRTAASLHALADTDSCLSAGGDLVCHVADPGAPDWWIGVEHPLDPSRLVARIPVRRGAVATSGLAHRGAHIVDPRTGGTPVGVASVTVVADDLAWADIDATAAFALGGGAIDWLSARPGRSGVVVWADGTAQVYEGPPPSHGC